MKIFNLKMLENRSEKSLIKFASNQASFRNDSKQNKQILAIMDEKAAWRSMAVPSL